MVRPVLACPRTVARKPRRIGYKSVTIWSPSLLGRRVILANRLKMLVEPGGIEPPTS